MFQIFMIESTPQDAKWILSGLHAISVTAKNVIANEILTVLVTFPSFFSFPVLLYVI